MLHGVFIHAFQLQVAVFLVTLQYTLAFKKAGYAVADSVDKYGEFFLIRRIGSLKGCLALLIAKQEFDAAVNAFRRSDTLMADEPGILFALADALAMQNNGSLLGEPEALVLRGLQRAPRFPNGLWLAGMANIGAALGGGLIGYHYVSLSTLGHRMRGDSRIVGLVVAIMCFLALTVGASALSYFSKFILGGLVMFIGLSFLYDWVVQSWRRLSRSDFAIIMLILAVVETIGFLEAVAVGIAAASVLFVVNYSRISAVRHTFSGSDLHANVERPNRQRKLLHDQGNKTLILKLQGFIFLATASNLLKKVEQSLDNREQPLEFLIIDFQHVTGLDSSALHGFVRIRQKVSDHGAQLIFSGMSADLEKQFSSEQFADGTALVDDQFADMDHAMEACENRLLLQNGMDPTPAHHSIEELLSGLFSRKDFIEHFARHLKRHDVRAGESLYNEGKSIRSLYFVESGEFTVSLSHKGSQEHRLREVGPGAVLGVSAFFHEDSHEAVVSVKAVTDGAVYGLSQADFEALKAESPELATEFQADMLRFFADRLASSLNVLEAVLRVED